MPVQSKLVNDGASGLPKLRFVLNLNTLKDLRSDSERPGLESTRLYSLLANHGFETASDCLRKVTNELIYFVSNSS